MDGTSSVSLVPKRTPLHPWHVDHGARMTDFGGWSMPLMYSSIVEEHRATRTAAGLFDISHMGRFRFDGPGSAAFLDSLVTRNIAALPRGRVGYALVTNPRGGILDDVLVYHLADATGGAYHLLVVNAGNREKLAAWIDGHLPPRATVTFHDASADWGMIAVQGPRALEIVQPLVDENLAALAYYEAAEARIAGGAGIVSRTGYTGEDGCELIVGAAAVERLWQAIVEQGSPLGLSPAGLGSRDTLRLEAGMPLYGHELTEEVDPLEAGLAWAVDLDKGHFIGREAIEKSKNDSPRRRRVGLMTTGKRVPRENCAILVDGRSIGRITSGTFSPTLERPIAMGYIEPRFGSFATIVDVDIRGRTEPAEIVKLPFYRRQSKGRSL